MAQWVNLSHWVNISLQVRVQMVLVVKTLFEGVTPVSGAPGPGPAPKTQTEVAAARRVSAGERGGSLRSAFALPWG